MEAPPPPYYTATSEFYGDGKVDDATGRVSAPGRYRLQNIGDLQASSEFRLEHRDYSQAEDLEASDKSPDKIVTVIREVMDAANATLAKESVAYKQLSGGQGDDSRTQPIPGIPRFFFFDRARNHDVLVIQRVNLSLLEAFRLCAPQFSLKTAITVTLSLMETLEQVHERGWTHGGLDMALIRYGARWEPEPESKRAYLTGFHSAQRYMDHPDGHKLPPARMSLYGSQDHQYNAGHVAFPTDDLIALFYMFRDMYSKLPWHDTCIDNAALLADPKMIPVKKKMPSELIAESANGVGDQARSTAFVLLRRKLAYYAEADDAHPRAYSNAAQKIKRIQSGHHELHNALQQLAHAFGYRNDGVLDWHVMDEAIYKHAQSFSIYSTAQAALAYFQRTAGLPPALKHAVTDTPYHNPRPAVPPDPRPIAPHAATSASGVASSRRRRSARPPPASAPITWDSSLADTLPYMSPLLQFRPLLRWWQPVVLASVVLTNGGVRKLKLRRILSPTSAKTVVKTKSTLAVAVSAPKADRLFPLRFRVTVPALIGTTTVRFAATNVVDLQRWLKALGVYTPEVTTWLLKCTPEGIPVTDPKIADPYALPAVNFFAPVGTAPPPAYRPHQFLTNVYVHPATYLLEMDANGVEAIVPARPPPPEEFPALPEASTRSAAMTNTVSPDYVRIVPMLLFDLPYEVTVLKGIIRSFDRQLHVTPAVQASLIERFRLAWQSYVGANMQRGVVHVEYENGASMPKADSGVNGAHGTYPSGHGRAGESGARGKRGIDGKDALHLWLHMTGNPTNLRLSGSVNVLMNLGERDGRLIVNGKGADGGHGGEGGNGGHGGVGADGAPGSPGSNGGDYGTPGGSGGPGGNGGDGGLGGDGGDGGHGGRGAHVVMAAYDTRLFMLVEARVDKGIGGNGGAGGLGGIGGAGGRGGPGGPGGSGAKGSSPSGSSGSNGWRGTDGDSMRPSRAGQRGTDALMGSLTWVMLRKGDHRIHEMTAHRYDLELHHFRVEPVDRGDIFEPGRQFKIMDVRVANRGGMTMPPTGIVRFSAQEGCQFLPECYAQMPAIGAGEVHKCPEIFTGFTLDVPAPVTAGEFRANAVMLGETELLGRKFRSGFRQQTITVQFGLALRGVEHPATVAVGEGVGPVNLRIKVLNKSSVSKGTDGANDAILLRLRVAPHLTPLVALPGADAAVTTAEGIYTRIYDPATRHYEVRIGRIDARKALLVDVPIQVHSDAPVFVPLLVQIELFHRDRLIQYDQMSFRPAPIYLPPAARSAKSAAAAAGRTLLVTTLEMTRARYLLWRALLTAVRMDTMDVWDVPLNGPVVLASTVATTETAEKSTSSAAGAAAVPLELYGAGSAILAPYAALDDLPWSELLQWAARLTGRTLLLAAGSTGASTNILLRAAHEIGSLLPASQVGNFGGRHLLQPSRETVARRAYGLIKKVRRHIDVADLDGVWVNEWTYQPARRRLILFTYGTCAIYRLPLASGNLFGAPPDAFGVPGPAPAATAAVEASATLDIDLDAFPDNAVPVGALPLASAFAQYTLGLLSLMPVAQLVPILLDCIASPDRLGLWTGLNAASTDDGAAAARQAATALARSASSLTDLTSASVAAAAAGSSADLLRGGGAGTGSDGKRGPAAQTPTEPPTTLAQWTWTLATGVRFDTAVLLMAIVRDRTTDELENSPVAALPTLTELAEALVAATPRRLGYAPLIVAVAYWRACVDVDAAALLAKLKRRKWRRNLTAEVRTKRLAALEARVRAAQAALTAIWTAATGALGDAGPSAVTALERQGKLWAVHLPRLPQLLAAFRRPLRQPSSFPYQP